MRIIYIIFRDLFIISGIGLLILLAMEDIQPGFVSFWFDIFYILWITGISGVLALATSKFARYPKK